MKNILKKLHIVASHTEDADASASPSSSPVKGAVKVPHAHPDQKPLSSLTSWLNSVSSKHSFTPPSSSSSSASSSSSLVAKQRVEPREGPSTVSSSASEAVVDSAMRGSTLTKPTVPEMDEEYQIQLALELSAREDPEAAQIEAVKQISLGSCPPENSPAEIIAYRYWILHFSLGGFAALMTAAESAQHVRGVVLLNSAGQFENPSEQPKNNEEETVLQKFVFNTLKEFIQRIILGFLFWQAKQPARVEKVLKSVYINASNVDNYLVESITKPAEDPNAGEVYYRLMTRFMSNQSKYTLNSVLSKLSCPLLLIWGDLDPWVGPAKAARIKEFYPNTTVVNLQAGHCPHDEVPELVNEALLNWLSSL